ncbi:hypothetical protein [Halpernia sp. GG3]
MFGGNNQLFSPGFWGTVLQGAAIGAAGGAIDAIVNGNNILHGIIRGAVIGGAVAGVTYTVRYFVTTANIKTQNYVLDDGQNVNGNNLPSDPNATLKDLRNANYGTDYGNPNDYLDLGKPLNPDGTFADTNGDHILAITTKIGFWSGRSSIAYSPAAFSNKYLVGDVMAHETAHAYGNYLSYISWGTYRDKIISIDPRLDTVEHVVIKKLDTEWVNLNNVPINSLRQPNTIYVYLKTIQEITSNFSQQQVNLYNSIYEKYKSIFIRQFIFK